MLLFDFRLSLLYTTKFLQCAWTTNSLKNEVKAYEMLSSLYFNFGDLKMAHYFNERSVNNHTEVCLFSTDPRLQRATFRHKIAHVRQCGQVHSHNAGAPQEIAHRRWRPPGIFGWVLARFAPTWGGNSWSKEERFHYKTTIQTQVDNLADW